MDASQWKETGRRRLADDVPSPMRDAEDDLVPSAGLRR